MCVADWFCEEQLTTGRTTLCVMRKLDAGGGYLVVGGDGIAIAEGAGVGSQQVVAASCPRQALHLVGVGVSCVRQLRKPPAACNHRLTI